MNHFNHRNGIGGVREGEVTNSREGGEAGFAIQHVIFPVVSNDVILDFRVDFACEFQHNSPAFIFLKFFKGSYIVDMWISSDQFRVVNHCSDGFFTD